MTATDATPPPKRRGRPPKPPEARAIPKPRREYARSADPVPTEAQQREARGLLAAWALAGGWPAPRPGWQGELGRRLGVRPRYVSEVWRGVRVMPMVWRGRMA